MATGVALVILGETALFLFLVYGFLHEDKFIEAEDRFIDAVKHNRKVRAAERQRKINSRACYTPKRPADKKATGTRAA